MAQTVKEFVNDSYQLISANSPTVGLHGDDQNKAVQFLNELIADYSSTALLLTIAQLQTFTVSIGQEFVTFADPTFLPAPNVPSGRLANLENAWLDLQGVTYPLINESRNVFFGSYKYDPQKGLPRFCIITNDLNVTTMRLYPAPSQQYTLNVYGKFQMSSVTLNSDMSGFPTYYIRFLKFALARDLAFYKGRASAWDTKLDNMLTEATLKMESSSACNLLIETSNESYLNGSWRVMAGI